MNIRIGTPLDVAGNNSQTTCASSALKSLRTSLLAIQAGGSFHYNSKELSCFNGK